LTEYPLKSLNDFGVNGGESDVDQTTTFRGIDVDILKHARR